MQLRFTVGGKKRFLTVQTKAQDQYYILQLSILRFEWGYKLIWPFEEKMNTAKECFTQDGEMTSCLIIICLKRNIIRTPLEGQ